jgi:hypothetical protein
VNADRKMKFRQDSFEKRQGLDRVTGLGLDRKTGLDLDR